MLLFKRRSPSLLKPSLSAVMSTAMLAACGGGGSDQPPGSPVGGTSNQYAQQCSANNPYRQDSDAGPNPTVASLELEKQWLRAYVDEAYLWYAKVPNVDASAATFSSDTPSGVYASLDSYLFALTNIPEDRFSFAYPTRDWKLLSESGVSLGYGAEFAGTAQGYRIAFVEPTSPAGVAGLRRGDTVASIDGVAISALSNAQVNAALLPSTTATHRFVFNRAGQNLPEISLTAGAVVLSSVPLAQVIDAPSGRIGYVLFNDHVLPAENQMATAMQGLAAQGINELVLDLRYNRGGYAYIASQVAYMVAGASRTSNQIFERQQFNDKRIAESNATESIIPFFSVKCLPDPNNNYLCTSQDALPALNLTRLWVLTTGNTCSASEAIVNGLRGVDVQVNIIGGTTCGKPYGFSAKDNCGISYFPIEFQGVNAKGFGDYGSGFAPTCAAADDFEHELGDPSEGLLSLAIGHQATASCIPASGLQKPGPSVASSSRLLPRPERDLKVHVHLPDIRR